MALETVVSRRNSRLLTLLSWLGALMGVLSVFAGLIVFIAPPSTFVQQVADKEPWLQTVWGVAFILGGLAATAGRASTVWLIESCGILLMAIGTVVYIPVITSGATQRGNFGALVAVAIMTIALLAMVYRYVELQIFLSEQGPKMRFRDLIRLRMRRTPVSR